MCACDFGPLPRLCLWWLPPSLPSWPALPPWISGGRLGPCLIFLPLCYSGALFTNARPPWGPPEGPRWTRGYRAYRRRGAPGMWQRFVNYLESDFPWLLGEIRQARERDGVRVVVAGPNAFVYFLDRE